MSNSEIMKVSKEMRKAIEDIQREMRKNGEDCTLIEASKILAKSREIEVNNKPLEEKDLLDLFD